MVIKTIKRAQSSIEYLMMIVIVLVIIVFVIRELTIIVKTESKILDNTFNNIEAELNSTASG